MKPVIMEENHEKYDLDRNFMYINLRYETECQNMIENIDLTWRIIRKMENT